MSTRIVRHLRLRASDEAVVRHIALRLEDALRTASLPEAGGRLVLVRRLALGRIPRDAAPQTLALGLERGVAALAAACLPAADPSAAAAPAVWFRDSLAAHTALALRLLAGQAADAWFWPLAVPAWRPAQPLPEALRRLAHSLAAQPEAPRALPLWAAALVHAGHGETLLAALTADDLSVLARAAGVPPEHAAAPPRRHGTRALAPVAAPRGQDHPPTARPPEDAPQRLLRALLRLAGASPAAPAADDPATAPGKPPSAVAAPSPAPADAPHRPRVPAAPPAADSPPASRPGPPPAARHPRQPAGRPRRTPAALAARPADTARPPPAAPLNGKTANAPWTFDSAPTRAGGLLFLLPVLARLGYPGWLAAHPEWGQVDLPRQLFAAILARLGVAADDPAWSLAPLAASGRMPPRFVAPATWHGALDSGSGPWRSGQRGDIGLLLDAAGRLPFGAWRGPCPRTLLAARRRARPLAAGPGGDILALAIRAWLTACRRWLRRYAGIGIADLVRRPATLSATPTHLDVFFALAQADLRLRRPGLDLDPGWLPWLGRVVSFHYRPGSAP